MQIGETQKISCKQNTNPDDLKRAGEEFSKVVNAQRPSAKHKNSRSFTDTEIRQIHTLLESLKQDIRSIKESDDRNNCDYQFWRALEKLEPHINGERESVRRYLDQAYDHLIAAEQAESAPSKLIDDVGNVVWYLNSLKNAEKWAARDAGSIFYDYTPKELVDQAVSRLTNEVEAAKILMSGIEDVINQMPGQHVEKAKWD